MIPTLQVKQARQSQVPKVRVRTSGARTQTQAGGSRLSACNLARLPVDPGPIRALTHFPPRCPSFPRGTGPSPPPILGQTDQEFLSFFTLRLPPYMASEQAGLEAF